MADEPRPTARAVVVGRTDVGRVREHNEDAFLVLSCSDGRRPSPATRRWPASRRSGSPRRHAACPVSSRAGCGCARRWRARW